MEFFDNHKKLFGTATLFFVGLTILVAILPALHMQNSNAVLPNAEPLSAEALKGKEIYIANGCIGCHTQQVRNVDMDKVWGSRPSIAADYAGDHRQDFWRNTATLLGSERTGPDLTNVGNRQASKDWQLVHLFNPRIVVAQSIMPSYSWLFEIKPVAVANDMVVNVPKKYLGGDTGKVVATREALQLVAYLLSLKQTKMPDGTATPGFLYKRETPAAGGAATASKALNGVALYTANCQSCHQENGEGLPGAFPPLKGSKVVGDANPELMVNIIMNGYTGREKEGFGAMPAVGTMNNLSADEISAIMNHERSSWGNNSKKVTPEEIQKLMDAAKVASPK